MRANGLAESRYSSSTYKPEGYKFAILAATGLAAEASNAAETGSS
jgi:hypothetical protein